MIFLGNPPFQDKENRGKTQHKLWIDFTQHVYKQMKPEDKLLWITPQSWGSPSSKILQIFRECEVEYVDLDTGDFFPEIGSSFSDYLLVKKEKTKSSTIIKNGKKLSINFDENLLYFPNDASPISVSIHDKVIFSQEKKLPVNFDYTTCHNILLKKSDSISKEKTDKHIYPVFHTNGQIWWSSKKQSFLNKKKVLWSRSGYTKPRFDDGNLGTTDMGYYVLVSSKEEGESVEKILNTELFQYIFKSAKWSGFGNEKVFLNLPDVRGLNINSEEDIYSHFNISEEEISFIQSKKAKKSKNKTNKIEKLVKSKQRSDNFGEVFTPISKVELMLLKLENKDYSQKFLDPSCGNGNFLLEVIKEKIKLGYSYKESISTVYGIDIMNDNIQECKERILSLNPEFDQEDINIINKNIICANSLEMDYYSITN